MEKYENAYREILEVLKKYKDIVAYDYGGLVERSETHLFGIKLKEKYGLNIQPEDVRSLDYFRVDDHRFIGWYGEKYRRTVSWSEDGKQPENELLLQFGYSTGAYIFGDDYPEQLFNEFFQELKSFNPKYSDVVNHCLYFSIETAKDIFNAYPEILRKYREINKVDFKKRKIAKLTKELESLQ